MVWFVRFVIVFTVGVPETDTKAHFRKENHQKFSEFHRLQVEVFKQMCLSQFSVQQHSQVSVLLCIGPCESRSRTEDVEV